MDSSRVVDLIVNSACSSKRRQHPTDAEVEHPAKQSAKVGIPQNSKGLPSSAQDDSKRARKHEPIVVSTGGPIGYSSANPLRIQSLERVHHGKVKVRSFVGDTQPSTSIGMAHLFGTHVTHINYGAGETEEQTIFSVNDESVEAAGVDVEAPPEDLLAYVKDLAEAKVAEELQRKNHPTRFITQQAAPSESSTALVGRFDRSALVAVGVLVEELVREMMTRWYQTGAPVQLDGRGLRTEALAQLNGTRQPKAITPDLLRSRLEVIFGQDLSKFMNDIELYLKVAKTVNGKPVSKRRVS